jgi:xanthine dehydrogenase accessory factor
MSISTRAVHERLDRLRTERVPYVHARVVLAERPTSAKPGDEAIVLGDGTIVGFVGGQCAVATVRNQGLEVLASGRSALIRIAGHPEPAQPGKTVVHNPCQSGGTLEIFMEPVLPAPVLHILGSSPIAMALTALGTTMGYETYSFDSPAGVAPDLAIVDAVVAASHGDSEESILESAVRANVPYIGLVASRKRGAAVLETLDLDAEQKARIHTPAGLDISARTPEEVAVSILAEIIATRTVQQAPTAAVTIDTAVDPVCHMDVAMVPTSIHADIDGQTWWFCCVGCQERFTADPHRFLEI